MSLSKLVRLQHHDLAKIVFHSSYLHSPIPADPFIKSHSPSHTFFSSQSILLPPLLHVPIASFAWFSLKKPTMTNKSSSALCHLPGYYYHFIGNTLVTWLSSLCLFEISLWYPLIERSSIVSLMSYTHVVNKFW